MKKKVVVSAICAAIIFSGFISILAVDILTGYTKKVYNASRIEKDALRGNFPNKQLLPVITFPSSGASITLPLVITGTVSEKVDYIRVRIDNGNWIRIDQKPSWSYRITSLGLGQHILYYESILQNLESPASSLNFSLVSNIRIIGKTYYIDSLTGSDAYDGSQGSMSTQTNEFGQIVGPWKTLVKINAPTLLPGDTVLFKRGCMWTGSFVPKGSGVTNGIIVIDAYGSGSKPVINAQGLSVAPVFLNANNYMTVRNLELMNTSMTMARLSGVFISLYNQTCRGVSLQDLDIHDVHGHSEWTGALKWNNAGIDINVYQDQPTKPTMINGLLIQGCYIHDLSTTGIMHISTTVNKSSNVLIKSNIIQRTGNDGIIVLNAESPRIIKNVCYDAGINGIDFEYLAGMWTGNSHSSVIMSNEVGYTHTQTNGGTLFVGDSEAFDIDVNDTGSPVIQYNYSHDNNGGFMLVMDQAKFDRLDIRYNVSINDHHVNCGSDAATLNINHDQTYVYNNVFFNSTNEQIRTHDIADVYYYNNIFQSSGGFSFGPLSVYGNNCYWGQTPSVMDPGKLLADPQFINPGAAGNGFSAALNYKIKNSSPCINKGMKINPNGGMDFWGDPLIDSTPDIGADEVNP